LFIKLPLFTPGKFLPSTRRLHTGREAMQQVAHLIEMKAASLRQPKHR
jgi:hypothetical protein